MTVRKTSIDRFSAAMAHGPFNYIAALIVGVSVGAVGFLVAEEFGNYVDLINPLPIFAQWAAIGAASIVSLAAVGNYVIGKRVLEQLELQREIFAGPEPLPLLPRLDRPSYDLTKPVADQSAQASAVQSSRRRGVR